MNVGFLGRVLTYLGTAAAILYAVGTFAFFAAIEAAYPDTSFATAWSAAFLVDTKTVVTLAIFLLALPALLAIAALMIPTAASETTRTTETKNGATTVTEVTKEIPRKDRWVAARWALFVLAVIALLVTGVVFGLNRARVGTSLPQVHMLEQDEEWENITGVLLSHDSDYWYVLVNSADLATDEDSSEGATAGFVKETAGDIKAIPAEEANNVRVTAPPS